MADTLTKLSPEDEATFQDWYKIRAKEQGKSLNPDSQAYDYRAAYLAGAEPNAKGVWPDQYKLSSPPPTISTPSETSIADLIRSKMGKSNVGDVTALPDSMGDPSPEQSRSITRMIAQKLGATPQEAQNLAPGDPIDDKSYSTMQPGSVDHITAQHEAAQAVQDSIARGLPTRPDTMQKVGDYLKQYEDASTAGLAAAVKFVNDVADKVGDKAGAAVVEGKLNLNIGMGQLDAFSKVDNWVKLGLFQFGATMQRPFADEKQRANLDAKRAYLTLKYLPSEVIKTPDGQHRFDNSTSMATWLAGQKIWGAMNDIAAIPAEHLGKVLGTMRMSDAEAFMLDLAHRDRAAAAAANKVAQTYTPDLIAGMAPMATYLHDVGEAQFKPETLDNIYKWYYDHGKLGTAIMAIETGLGTYADYQLSPTVLMGEIPAGLFKYTPKITRALNPEMDARITSSIARRTWQMADAWNAHESAKNLTKIAQDAIDTAAAKGHVPAELYQNLIKAKKNEAREFLWLDQFSDPGQYEPMMPRAGRRSPEHVPELKDTQYYSFIAQDANMQRWTDSKVPEYNAPHGAYFSEGTGKTFYDVVGNNRITMRSNPNAKVLDVPPNTSSAGMAALRKLVSTQEHDRLYNLSTPDLKAEVQKMLPGTDLSHYTEKYQLLEVLGATYARKAGYSIIRQTGHADPQLNTLVALDSKAANLAKENVRPRLRVTTQRELTPESQHAMRKQTLAEGAHMPVDWQDPKQLSLGEMEQRTLLGPSDSEYIGDALNMMVRNATIDDVVTSSHLTPEYHILPDVQTSLVDMRKVEQANKQAAIEAMTSPKLLAEEERQTRIALGRAKAVNAADLVEQHRANLRLIKKTRKNLEPMLGEQFDTAALPEKVPGIMQNAERFNKHLETFGDRAVRSLYPGGLMLVGWHTRLGQMIGMSREPMRYYQSYAPQRWEEIRGGLLNMDTFHKGSTELLTRVMTDAGVMVKREKFDRLIHFAPTKVDKNKAEQLAKMLDTVVGTEEHAAATAGASPEMMRAHDTCRAILDKFADMQGISATDRYLSGYFRHMWDNTLFDHGARSVEFIGIPNRSEMMVSHLLHRNGAPGYKLDAPLIMDLYMRAAYRKLIMEPVYKNIIKTGEELATQFNNPSHISYANDLVNQMKGKPSFVSAKVDDMIAGAINANGGIALPFTDKKITYAPGWLDRQMLGLFSMLHSGLTIGPHYPILQIASGLATTAGRYGPFATMRGVFMYATKEGQQLGKAAGTYRPFVDYLESKPFQKFMEFVQGNAGGKVIPLSNSWAEGASRGITYNVAMKHYMNKMGFGTVEELMRSPFGKRVMFESMRSAEECNHLYGPLGRSPIITRIYGSSASTAATQLLSFIPKQSEELISQAGRNPGHIMRYFAFSGALMRMAANAGIDMTHDVGYGYLPRSLGDITSPAVDAAIENVMLQDAIDRGDGAEVERRTANLMRMLPNLIPGYLLVNQGAKAVQRLQNQTVQDRQGNPVYRMDMMPSGQNGLGGEFVPTVLMQRNIRETLARRGLQLAKQKNARNEYLAQKARDHYVDAVDRHDQNAAQKYADELMQHGVRIANPVGSIESAMEVRAYSYTVRNLQEHPQLLDQFQELYRQYNIPVTP